MAHWCELVKVCDELVQANNEDYDVDPKMRDLFAAFELDAGKIVLDCLAKTSCPEELQTLVCKLLVGVLSNPIFCYNKFVWLHREIAICFKNEYNTAIFYQKNLGDLSMLYLLVEVIALNIKKVLKEWRFLNNSKVQARFQKDVAKIVSMIYVYNAPGKIELQSCFTLYKIFNKTYFIKLTPDNVDDFDD